MNRTILVIVLAACSFFCIEPAGAQAVDSVTRYIDSAIHFMQTKSLKGKKLDWKKIKDSTYLIAKEATTYKDAFPAIAYAFKQLKDYHGMVANQDTFYRYPPPINFDEVLSPGIKKEFLKGNRIVTSYLENSIAYLRVPSMNVTRQQDMNDRANKLRDSLCHLLQKNPRGIIVDLRMNSGGNSAPMVSALGPLFRNSLLGYGVDRDGKLLSASQLRDGVLIDEKGNKMVAINNSCGLDKPIPMAVLIGPSTVSSAEILAVYLKRATTSHGVKHLTDI